MYVGVQSSGLMESAHVARCMWHKVLDHKSVHVSTLLLLYIGIERQLSDGCGGTMITRLQLVKVRF